MLDQLPVVSDSDWRINNLTSRPQRGIRDYDRFIKFERDLTVDELDKLVQWLAENNSPGWTGIWSKKVSDFEYRFQTTWDSSD